MSRFPSAWQSGLDASREARRQERLNHTPEAWVTCPDCCGEGSNEEGRPQHDDPYFAITIKCERCGGSGWEHK